MFFTRITIFLIKRTLRKGKISIRSLGGGESRQSWRTCTGRGLGTKPLSPTPILSLLVLSIYVVTQKLWGQSDYRATRLTSWIRVNGSLKGPAPLRVLTSRGCCFYLSCQLYHRHKYAGELMCEWCSFQIGLPTLLTLACFARASTTWFCNLFLEFFPRLARWIWYNGVRVKNRVWKINSCFSFFSQKQRESKTERRTEFNCQGQWWLLRTRYATVGTGKKRIQRCRSDLRFCLWRV